MCLGVDIKERLAKQRQLLNVRLGLDVASKVGIDISGIFSNEDLQHEQNNVKIEENNSRVMNFICLLYVFVFLTTTFIETPT